MTGRRWTAAALLLGLAVLSASVALAQESSGQEGYDLPKVMEDFFASKAGQDVIARYSPPMSGVVNPDDILDGEFSTGEPPQVDLPGTLDIQDTWSFEMMPAPPFFSPVDQGGLFCEPDPLSPAVPGIRTFCPDGFDPGAFDQGARATVIEVTEPFGFFDLSKTCEWVVWYHMDAQSPVFENLPQYPNDPAAGTNIAFGFRAGPNEFRPFRLTYVDKVGGFRDDPTNTVVAFGENQVTVFTPLSEVPDPVEANSYTFCTGGRYQASDSVADQTGLFPITDLVLEQGPPPTTTTTTSSTTTTTTTPTATTGPPTTVTATGNGTSTASSGAGRWITVLLVGLALFGFGMWLRARRSGCEELLRAMLAARSACEKAEKAKTAAHDQRTQAEETLDEIEEDLEQLCDEMPPACWTGPDSWVEDPNVPGSRIDRWDLFVKRSWARSLWAKYRSGEMTAQQVEQGWEQDPPSEFGKDLQEKLDAAKAKKTRLDTSHQKAKADVATARAAEEKAIDAAIEACRAASKAWVAYQECMGKAEAGAARAAAGAAGTSTTTADGGSTTSVADGGGTDDGTQPCKDGTEQLRNVRTERANIPVGLDPGITGGHAHAATELADEIGSRLRQGEVVAQALGRLFSLAPGASLVHEVTATGLANLGVAAAGEATGIPTPTDLPTAAANVSEVVLHAARAIITKVPELQERRLPDVDMHPSIKVSPYTMTCAEVWVCQGGTWVMKGKRMTIERGATRSWGRYNWTALTWAEAQQKLADLAQGRYRAMFQTELAKLSAFQRACAGG